VRIWSLHPRLLDAKGLVALWRETLLAQAVLQGRTRGYRSHPQLERFRDTGAPVGAVATYLRAVHDESLTRGYRFDRGRISRARFSGTLTVTRDQLAHEREHLLRKLAVRDPERAARLETNEHVLPHPLFRVIPGPIATWEKT